MAEPGRLRRKREFERTFSQGAHVRSPLMKLAVAAADHDEIRFGTAVSRRVSRRAVHRNRVRRRLREAFRRAAPDLPPGYDVVCIPYGTDKDPEPPFEDLVLSFERLAREAVSKLERRLKRERRQAAEEGKRDEVV